MSHELKTCMNSVTNEAMDDLKIARIRAAVPCALVLSLCLAARLAYLGGYLQEPRPVQSDGYPEIALNIITGKGFSAAAHDLIWLQTPETEAPAQRTVQALGRLHTRSSPRRASANWPQ